MICLSMSLIQTIKNILKTILPNSIKRSDKKVDELKKEIEGLKKDIVSLQKETVQREKDLLKEVSSLKNDIQRLTVLSYDQLDPKLYPHALKQWYQGKTGDSINLDEPKTYNEKLQWAKVYDRNPLRTMLSDKLQVREWIKEKIGEEYLIPLLASYKKAEEIDFEALPDRFVLKANHGSGMNIIVRDKNKEDLQAIRKKANQWLRTNYAFQTGYELQYNDIPRRLIVEEYIENSGGELTDYKLFCFDGKCRFIQVLQDRSSGTLRTAFFDPLWNKYEFTKGNHPMIEKEIKKPDCLSELLRIAEVLSKGFPHVRVDLYVLDDGSIKFGEMTFTPGSGIAFFDPPEIDEWVGEMYHLPEKDISSE